MKKTKRIKRVIAIALAFVMLACSLFSCKKTDEPEKITLENVYKVNYLESELDENSWIRSAELVGDDIYFIANYSREVFVPFDNAAADGEEVQDTYYDIQTLPVTDLAGKAIAVDDVVINGAFIGAAVGGVEISVDESIEVPVDESEGTYEYENGLALYKVSEDGKAELVHEFEQTYESNNNFATFKNYNYIIPTQDGNVWTVEQNGYDDWSDPNNYVYESETYIKQYDSEFNEITGFSIMDMVGDNLDTEESADWNGEIYVDRFFVDTEREELLIYTNYLNKSIFIVSDFDGNFIRSFECGEDVWLNSLTKLADGTPMAMYYKYDEETQTQSRILCKIDSEAGKLEDLSELPLANVYNFFPAGEGSKIYLSNSSMLYEYDINSGELKEKINWLNSDINYNWVQVLAGGPGGTVLISERSRDYRNNKLALLTPSPAGDVVEKYVVTLASVSLSTDMIDAIISFNKQNDEYRIIFNDYSVYITEDDYEAGINQLNNDIISGKLPDILSLSGLDSSIYTSKGLLQDIGVLIENDEEFDVSEYYENILKSTSDGEEIYSIIPNFSISTYAGKKSIFGDGMSLTMEKLAEIRKQYPDAKVFEDMTRANILNTFANYAIDKYIDKETGNCYFDSDEFIAVLEFINGFPEEIDWNSYYDDMTEEDYMAMELQYFEDRTLLRNVYLSGFYSNYALRMFGEEISYIGFPVPEGMGSLIQPNSEIAISAKSKVQEVAWDFIKYIISYDYQKESTYSFSINRRVNEEMAKEAIEESVKRFEQMSDIIYPEVGTGENDKQEILNQLYQEKPLTQADVDKVFAVIENVETVQRENEEIRKILLEDTADYFAGQKTAAEVAKTIQSKMTIYINENR